MLAANVLCLKKKKRRTYCLSSASNCKGYGPGTSKDKRGGTVTMMQITEDTPPDMLAGAMDLTVHLPNGKAVKMSVERSTPMMDLLVQITTTNHLQLSNHSLQVLGMAPSLEHSDKILPFKPNTPIGTLDTQHIKVLPKIRTLPAPKYIAPGHQPFESTFRLKVHLPRNQLYVTRVSRNVLLEDIMKKVCEEKNLDPLKYDFKHPGNLDEVLDPKSTLSDYQITEIYVVAKGTTNLNQAFSAADIMVLRKEEERKQMHNKTGGGVFNLIFKRGKSSMGSGSVSSDNRSISPTQSDDSRSVTPPAVQALPIVAPPKKDPPPDRPKPPQRKRRPAPKPPQIQVAETSKESEEKSSVVSNELPSSTASKKTSENGMTICHSRNSSDSSGYHEASILSDHCANTSLPRNRPKSAFVGDAAQFQSTSNLSKMSAHSRSTTSLVTGRKKKPAPPPPPVAVSPASSVVVQSDTPSPLVASQSDISTLQEFPEVLESPSTNPAPKPRPRKKAPTVLPRARPQSEIYTSMASGSTSTSSARLSYQDDVIEQVEKQIEEKLGIRKDEEKDVLNRFIVDEVVKETLKDPQSSLDTEEIVELRRPPRVQEEETAIASNNNNPSMNDNSIHVKLDFQLTNTHSNSNRDSIHSRETTDADYSMEEILTSLEAVKPFIMNTDLPAASTPKELNESNEDSPKTTMSNLQKSVVSTIFNSEEFLKESKPPEIVGVIPKTPKSDKKLSSNKDSFGKKRCFQIGSSLEQQYDPETASINSKRSAESKSSRNSVASALNALDDEIADLDEKMFTGSLSKGSTKKRPEVFNQLFGIHGYDKDISFQRNISVSSLRSSVGGIPGLNGVGLSKWNNFEDLDSISINSYGASNRWVAGDASDTESVSSANLTPAQTTRDIIAPCPSEIITPIQLHHEEKSLDSTDSGIAQDNPSDREKEDVDEEFGFRTPPPPPILDETELPATPKTSLVSEPNSEAAIIEGDRSVVSKETTQVETELTNLKAISTVQSAILPPPLSAPKPLGVDLSETTIKKTNPEEVADIDWQYQLPSPPKAFRDSSPTNLTLNETNSISDFKDSVVTSPELFEKLRTLEDNQSEKDTLKSEDTSVASEEPLNTLSLEHLEKRKSLVYNRELATSLKMTDSIESSVKTTETFASPHSGFQTAYNKVEKKNSVPQEQPPKPARTSSQHHTLPNFKITTYDVPKHQNIKVFEDDTISSNTHGAPAPLARTQFGHSMENISFNKRNSISDFSNNKEKEYTFYKSKPNQVMPNPSVFRSESFSTENRLSFKPVSRSKSSLMLNKHQIGKTDEANISRSNSLFDVSGLQSLEVMKLIQNKLNTPTGSMENVSVQDKPQIHSFVPQASSPQVEVALNDPSRSPAVAAEESQEIKHYASSRNSQVPTQEPVKKYYYRGPPAVNMSTWSERPKIPVAVKEDEDYKLGNANNNNISSKLIVNTTNNNITSNNSILVRSSNGQFTSATRSAESIRPVSVNVNGTEQISQKSGNVVIKIGGSQNTDFTKSSDSQRFMGPTAYRKPFGNINRANGNTNTIPQRPHSIAFSSDFDISRVPVVRSVEFKKPYRDFHGSNTSITHLNQEHDDFQTIHHSYDKSDSFAEKFRSSENLKNIEKQESEAGKRVFRVGSFKPLGNQGTPIVRGFKSSNKGNNDINHRLSWNPSATYDHNTLPAKPKPEAEYVTNKHVPFSQSTLRRTDSSKLYAADHNSNDISKFVEKQNRNANTESESYSSLPPSLTKTKMQTVPPPPPQMPKMALKRVAGHETSQSSSSSPTDPRDMLLESIRTFGGKKGLKAVKA